MIQQILIFIFAASLSRGLALPIDFFENQLPDLWYTQLYSQNSVYFYGFPRDRLDRQVNCRVTFPNGVLYSLWPNFNITEPTITLPHDGVDNGCYIGFRNPPPFFSGTYEVQSLVGRPDGSLMLTRRKYHMSFVWLRSSDDENADDSSNKEIIVEDSSEETVKTSLAARLDFFEIQLPDLSFIQNYEENKVFHLYGIPRDDQDFQVNCRVNFPDGVLYSLWPNFNITEPTITLPVDGIRRGCYIACLNPPPSLSGTYHVKSLVGRPDGSLMLVSRKYHLTFRRRQSDGDATSDIILNKEVIAKELSEDTI